MDPSSRGVSKFKRFKTDSLACIAPRPVVAAIRLFKTTKSEDTDGVCRRWIHRLGWELYAFRIRTGTMSQASYAPLHHTYITFAFKTIILDRWIIHIYAHCRPKSPWRRRKFLLGTCSLVDGLFRSPHVLILTIYHCRCVICRDGEIIAHGHNETNMTRNVRIPIHSFAVAQSMGIFISEPVHVGNKACGDDSHR